MKFVVFGKHYCEYCNGKGYFQLMLGGSETCPSCQGSGDGEEEEA